MPLNLHRLSTLKLNDGAKTAAVVALLPGTTAEGLCHHPTLLPQSPAPRGDHPAYPKLVRQHSHCCIPETGNLEVTSDVGRSTAHKAQPYRIHQEQPGHWEQQTSTLREPADASRNLRKAPFTLYKQAKTLNSYQALITRTTEKGA